MKPGERSSQLVRFYSGFATDVQGRWIEDIWAWSNDTLESVHDYIQWLFPLPVASDYNTNAPIIDHYDVEMFREDERLRSRLRRSLERMLEFYGLQLNSSSEQFAIERTTSFTARSDDWLHSGNHNHLRLTRILKSTQLLGLEGESEALRAALMCIALDYPDEVSAETRGYWNGGR